ncbi:hypothetical protein A9B99_09210 [Mangrovibacter phragmitis]|uniref:Uncharacterized protein n=1 Tax=Mangrovibacter phragmitis TaxID=1691903 RepID=A0A1B7L2I8_9ENTR|nr:hypothetical protein [Mangrovibacter phragmitis]OAT76478.1 hypothetical protein A9B99_09210 [Mangrovibacter phragmitis]
MFNSLKALWQKAPVNQEDNNQQAQQLSEQIALLEQSLAQQPDNAETQKALMLEYNRALRAYAASPVYRPQVETLFTRIDELRNIIRRNI